jgi:hypothetical protein
MANPYTKENALELAEELIKVSNRCFGYRLVLYMVLSKHGYSEDKIKEIKQLARDRKIEQVQELLK